MRHTPFLFALLLLPRFAAGQQSPVQGHVPPAGFVPDSATAVRIAVAVWDSDLRRTPDHVREAVRRNAQGQRLDGDRQSASCSKGACAARWHDRRQDCKAGWMYPLRHPLLVSARPNMRLKLAALLLKEGLCCLMFSTSAAA